MVQKKYKIQPFQSLGELFKALAVMSGEMIEEVIELLKKDTIDFIEQNEFEMTYYKKPFESNEANESTEISTFVNRLRAFVPFPGLNFKFQEKKYTITSYDVVEKKGKRWRSNLS